MTTLLLILMFLSIVSYFFSLVTTGWPIMACLCSIILLSSTRSGAEFVLYKLKEMGKITQNDISLVMKEFEELDVDQSGTLSVYDLEV